MLSFSRFTSLIILVILIGGLMPGCRPQPQRIHFTGKAQGTYYAVTFYSERSLDLQPSVDSLLREFDLTASLWVPESLINRVNKNEDVPVNEDFRALFSISSEVSEASGGYFDITVGPLVRAWGFGVDQTPAIREGTLDSLMPLVNYRNVRIEGEKVRKTDPRIQLDFNAVAQGYSVDQVGALLESRGITDYLVDIGGELLARGAKPGGEPWKVGIEKPSEEAGSERIIFAEVPVSGRAVATSGNYRKFYEKEGVRYSHTIDPTTGRPVSHTLLSVTVLAPTCAYADAWATAIMAMGPEKALIFIREKKNGLDIYGIYSTPDGRLETFMTDGLKNTLEEVRR